MTFYLYKNTVNTITNTVTEKATITASSIVYLFNFIDETSKREYNFHCANISTATTRYDQFQIIETGSTQILSAATLSLGSNFGWYTYNIYEQTGTTNYTPANAVSKLETGQFYLTGTTAEVSVSSHQSDIYIKSHR